MPLSGRGTAGMNQCNSASARQARPLVRRPLYLTRERGTRSQVGVVSASPAARNDVPKPTGNRPSAASESKQTGATSAVRTVEISGENPALAGKGTVTAERAEVAVDFGKWV